jgi:hypothetical protein
MGPLLLLLQLVLATPSLGRDAPARGEIPSVPDQPFETNRTDVMSFSGRFAPDGTTATIEITTHSGIEAPRPVARILTDECRARSTSLDFDVLDRPLAILDLDGDGHDEVFLLEGGNTVYNAVVARIDGCRLVALERSDAHHPLLSFFGHGNCCPDSGTGISCRRAADGSVEILATEYESWTTWDPSNPDEPVQRPGSEAPWTRTVYAVRGKQLVVTSTDAGITKIRDDPSVPLLNRFDCLGSIYPPD